MKAGTEPVPSSLTAAIEQIASKPRYAHSSWGLRVEDRTTGEVLLDQAGEAMFTTGSVLKVYSTSTALHLYGADHTFKTPVYRTGPVDNGALDGDLVLVASGDFSMGLRERPDGTMVFALGARTSTTPTPTLACRASVVGVDPLAGAERPGEAGRGVGRHEGRRRRRHR